MQEHTKTTAVSRTKYSFRVFHVLKCDIWGFAYMIVRVFIPYISGPGKEKQLILRAKGIRRGWKLDTTLTGGVEYYPKKKMVHMLLAPRCCQLGEPRKRT